MKVPRRALVLLLWPAFCGLVVGGGLGLITGSLSAGLLFAVIAVVVSLLILNGWEMENIAESEESRSLSLDPLYANLPGNVWYDLNQNSQHGYADAPRLGVGLDGDPDVHSSDFSNDRWH